MVPYSTFYIYIYILWDDCTSLYIPLNPKPLWSGAQEISYRVSPSCSKIYHFNWGFTGLKNTWLHSMFFHHQILPERFNNWTPKNHRKHRKDGIMGEILCGFLLGRSSGLAQHNYWKLMKIANWVPMMYLVKRVIFQFALLVYVSLPECIWRFPKMGAPPNHPRPVVTWGSTKCDNDIV